MKKNYNNARELLQEVFGNYINSNKELEVKDEIMKNILSEYGDEGLNISLFVKDCSISNWLPSEHFSKIYYDELKYVKDQYGLSSAEKNLLLSLAPYLMWETNLLVDEDSGQPLSQNELVDKLEINKTTMIRNVKGLYEKKLLCPFTYKKKKYFMINPYIMYNGKRIDKFIVDVFKLMGYINRTTFESDKKNNG